MAVNPRVVSGVKAALYVAVFTPILTTKWPWLGPVPSFPRLVMLAAGTALVLLAEHRTWLSIGVTLSRRFIFQVGRGVLFGASAALTLAGVSAAFGCRWTLGDPWAALLSVLFALSVATFEELAFRGYLFFRAQEAIGTWKTIFLSAVFFACLHGLNGPFSETALPALGLGVGAVALGFAVADTGLIATSIGLHWMWNAILGGVFGFNLIGHPSHGLFVAHPAGPAWATGGVYGPGSSLPGILVLGATFVFLFRLSQSRRV